MYCKHCGTELSDEAKFCTSCGAPQDSQPQYGMQGSKYEKPANYLVLAIIVTLLCCLPLGIVSIVYSGKVDTALSRGDISEAETMSRKARNWAIAGIATSVVSTILYFIIMLILIGLGSIDSIWGADELFSI